MAFKEQIIGFSDLERNVQALARMMKGNDVAAALEDGAWVVVERARTNAFAQGLHDTGDLVDSIKPKKINQFRVDVEVGVIYGAAHEFGLDKQVITDRQRAFFWAMFATTGDEMWKALALSATYTIPARPYMRPAIDHGPTQRLAAETAAKSLAFRMARSVT